MLLSSFVCVACSCGIRLTSLLTVVVRGPSWDADRPAFFTHARGRLLFVEGLPMDPLSSLSGVPQQANQHVGAQHRWPSPSPPALAVTFGLLYAWICRVGMLQTCHECSIRHASCVTRNFEASKAPQGGRWSLHCGSAALHGSTSRRCASHISTIASRFFTWVFARCAFYSHLCRALHGFHVVVTVICFCLSPALPHGHDVPIGCAFTAKLPAG